MKQTRAGVIFYLVAGFWVLTGCVMPRAQHSTSLVAARTLFVSAHCGTGATTGSHVSWISSPDRFREAVHKAYEHVLGAGKREIPAVDFRSHGVLMVNMGRQPNAGYRLDPDRVSAVLENRTLVVHLAWHSPSREMVTAQIITTPCIMIRLPRKDFSQIRVFDQTDRLIGEVLGPLL